MWINSPRLHKEYVELLTNVSLITTRAQRVMDGDPGRFEGHAIPSPLTVMGNLKAYLENSFKAGPRKIKDNNKKWLLCLGDSCKDLVEMLGFTREV